jgi:hypothetical protein
MQTRVTRVVHPRADTERNEWLQAAVQPDITLYVPALYQTAPLKAGELYFTWSKDRYPRGLVDIESLDWMNSILPEPPPLPWVPSSLYQANDFKGDELVFTWSKDR